MIFIWGSPSIAPLQSGVGVVGAAATTRVWEVKLRDQEFHTLFVASVINSPSRTPLPKTSKQCSNKRRFVRTRLSLAHGRANRQAGKEKKRRVI
eukprot:6268492-Amphidinium_carterae.1